MVAGGLYFSLGTGARAAQGGTALEQWHSSTHIVVKFAPGVTFTAQESGAVAPPRWHSSGAVALPTLHAGLQVEWERWRVARTRRAYPGAFGRPAVAARYGLDRTYILEVPAGTDTAAMAAALATFDDEIEFADVDAIGGVAAGLIPNDPLFSGQYGMHNEGQTGGLVDADIDAPQAWKLHTGNAGTVTVAIVDSGVNEHPEFLDRMVAGINTDDPANPDLTTDGCPHGTLIAGIVGAKGDNGIGVAGVTWGANIMPVRVLGNPNGCSGSESAAASGVIWAADNGADIINMSLQYCSGGQNFQDAVDYAHDLGVLVVSAAGNNNACGVGIVAAPARFTNSMAVSGTTDRDEFATFATTASPLWNSNFGEEIDVCAPGDRIWSTSVGDGYIFLSGTSPSTPHVSGLAALLKSFVPTLTRDELRNVIIATADDLGPSGWDNEYGHGRINAFSALEAARCTSDIECDDGIACTDDACVDGECVSTPDDAACADGLFCNGAEICHSALGCQAASDPCNDGIECTIDSCDESSLSCTNAPDDAACDDGLFCNGAEVCDSQIGCRPESDPCDDGVDCTVDSCDESLDMCMNTPNDAACDDGLFCNGLEVCDPDLDCVVGDDPCGLGLSCEEEADECVEIAVPAVSEWGLIIITLLLLAASKICFGRRRCRLSVFEG